MTIHCRECRKTVEAVPTTGLEIHPHRPDPADPPFRKCPAYGTRVGCHHRGRDRTRPLGSIPNADARRVRMRIHRVLDPLWESGRFGRTEPYRLVAAKSGLAEFHAAEVDSVGAGWRVVEVVEALTGDRK